MKTLNDYLNAYVSRLGITSDYQLSKALCVSRQAVSKYRNNLATPESDVAWRIADGLGIDPAEVIAAAEIARAERTHHPERVALWSKRLQQVTAAVMLMIAGFLPSLSIEARAAESRDSVYY